MKTKPTESEKAEQRATRIRRITRRCGLARVMLLPRHEVVLEQLADVEMNSNEGRELLEKLPTTYEITQILMSQGF